MIFGYCNLWLMNLIVKPHYAVVCFYTWHKFFNLYFIGLAWPVRDIHTIHICTEYMIHLYVHIYVFVYVCNIPYMWFFLMISCAQQQVREVVSWLFSQNLNVTVCNKKAFHKNSNVAQKQWDLHEIFRSRKRKYLICIQNRPVPSSKTIAAARCYEIYYF